MNISALATQPQRSPKMSGLPYLRVLLSPQTPAVFAMQHVQEAVLLPAQRLTPMPNIPACLLGLTNRRSRVMWVVDLARLLGLSTLSAAIQQHSVVVVQVGSTLLGLAVHRIEGITWIESSAIQSPPGKIAAPLVPYLEGCVLHQQEAALVLDAEAIVQSPLLRFQ